MSSSVATTANNGIADATFIDEVVMAQGKVGMEVLRAFVQNYGVQKMLGAFRGQGAQTVQRFSSGHGITGPGPYFGLDQPSTKLNFEQFRRAMRELNMVLPASELEGMFHMLDAIGSSDGSSDGLIDFDDIIREVNRPAGHWDRQRIGQVYAPARQVLDPDIKVVPSRRTTFYT